MTTHIALLRGINVGRHRRIAMAELRAMLTARGYTEVATLLASGNVVLTAESADPAAVARDVEAGIAERFGFDVRVVVRSHAQIERVVRRNPLPDEAAANPKLFHVGFADPAVSEAAIEDLAGAVRAPERMVVDEGTFYLWFAGGMHDSPLSRELTRRGIADTVTMRNWNTVEKLRGMVRG